MEARMCSLERYKLICVFVCTQLGWLLINCACNCQMQADLSADFNSQSREINSGQWVQDCALSCMWNEKMNIVGQLWENQGPSKVQQGCAVCLLISNYGSSNNSAHFCRQYPASVSQSDASLTSIGLCTSCFHSWYKKEVEQEYHMYLSDWGCTTCPSNIYFTL